MSSPQPPTGTAPDCLDGDGRLETGLARAIAGRVQGARRFVVLTGAGVSAESGIPTFRDARTGIWARFSPQALATPEAFAADPARVWAWYEWRRSLLAGAQPNPGHHALRELERRVPALTLVTQNVDGLHQAAGSRGVVEFHGSIRRTRCVGSPSHRAPWPLPESPAASPPASGAGSAADEAPSPASDTPPACPRCGALLRPDVVWFGEAIPEAALVAAGDAVSRCDVLVSAGTSTTVHPAAGLAGLARDAGACVIEVNRERTPLSPDADYVLLGESGKLLPALVEVLAGAAGGPGRPASR